MKNLACISKLALIIALWGFTATNLWAAEAPREDGSDLFMWIFLAFCALIVVAQLIPAILVLMGFVKGVKKEKVTVPPRPVDDLTSPEG